MAAVLAPPRDGVTDPEPEPESVADLRPARMSGG
jgi:hypothetical protein